MIRISLYEDNVSLLEDKIFDALCADPQVICLKKHRPLKSSEAVIKAMKEQLV